MTQRVLFSPSPIWRLPQRATLLVAALALALAGLTAGTRPARADTEDILRFLAGAIVIGAIVNAFDENRQPGYAGHRVLPDGCLETIRVNGRNIQAYNARCLGRAGYDGLPSRCRYDFRVGGGHTRTGFIAECMYEAGYRRGSGGGYYPPSNDLPPYNRPGWGHPGGGYPGGGYPGVGRPPIGSPGTQWLPAHCQMTYRQSGQRIDGYWAGCLRDAGLYELPNYCRVTSTGGDAIYNAECLHNANYRRRR